LLETSFYYWKRELRKRDAATASTATKSSPAKEPRPTFVPLTVLPTATLSVEVRCPSGHVVVLSASDEVSLASLFAALNSQAREGRTC